jgi:chemotaxis protein MotD
MNTGTVVPLPIAAGEAAADTTRGANRGATEDGEAGGFLKLVVQLGQNQGRRGRSEATPSGGAGEGGVLNVGAWLVGEAESPRDGAGDRRASADEGLATRQWDQLALQLALAGVTDPKSLAQLLAAGAGPGQEVQAGVAVAARFANGTATETDIELVRASLALAANGEMPSIPDATMLASLAKATSQADARRAGQPAPETMGRVSVLGRETHLAPVLAVALEGKDPSVARARQPGDTADFALAIGDPNLDSELANPQSAATAIRDARWGPPSPRSDGSPLNPQQPAPGGPAGDEGLPAAGAFNAASAVHADGLFTAGAVGNVVQQIGARVAAEAGTMLGQAARSDATAPGLGQHFGSPIKVIHLELQPDGLGAVRIRLAVKDQTLHLALEVGRGDTASLIQRDRDTLSALLRSAGYLIEGVDVRMAGPNGLAAPPLDGQSGMQMSAGGQSRDSQPEGRPPGAGPQDNSRGSNPGHRQNGEEDQIGRNRGRGGGLYV